MKTYVLHTLTWMDDGRPLKLIIRLKLRTESEFEVQHVQVLHLDPEYDGKRTLQLVTTASERYQDGRKLFRQAFRSSLSPPGPREKAKNLAFRTPNVILTIRENSIKFFINPFKGPNWGGTFASVYGLH